MLEKQSEFIYSLDRGYIGNKKTNTVTVYREIFYPFAIIGIGQIQNGANLNGVFVCSQRTLQDESKSE